MIPSSPQTRQQFRGKLVRRTLLQLLPVMMIPVIILGLITLYNSNNFLRQQVAEQFTNVGNALADKINALVSDQRAYFDDLLSDPDFTDSLHSLISTSPDSPNWQSAREQFLSNYSKIAQQQSQHYFDNLVVVTPDNEILVSTNPAWEGKPVSPNVFGTVLNEPASALLHNHYPFNYPLYKENENSLILLTSQRIVDTSGNLMATLIGITNTPQFKQILETSQLIHPDIRTYFITNLSKDATFVGMLPTSEVPSVFIPTTDHREYVLPALVNNPDADEINIEFHSFQGLPVLGMARNLPEIDAALVFEIPQTVFTEPIQKSFTHNTILILVTLLVIAVIIWYGTQRLVHPIVEVATSAQHFADGDMRARAIVNRNDEIGLLAYTFNYLADQLTTLYRSMETAIESRTKQIRVAAEVAQISTTTNNLDEILKRIVNLIVERFGYYHASIFMLDRSGERAVLMQSAGVQIHSVSIPVGGRSIVGHVTATNQLRIAFDVKRDPYYLKHAALPETQSEIAIPLSVGNQVLGALDIQTNEPHTFDDEEIATLQTLAQQIASAVRNIRLLENTRTDLQATNLLYQASHKFATASTRDGVLTALTETFRQVPHMWAIFVREENSLRVAGNSDEFDGVLPPGREFSATEADVRQLLELTSWGVIHLNDPPEQLLKGLKILAKRANCRAFVLIPFASGEHVLGGILLGSDNPKTLTKSNLDPYYSIAEMANTALEKIAAVETITQSYAELQSLNSIGQAISTETELKTLFEILHQQIIHTIGQVGFLVALYDAQTELIEVPYMTEENQIISVPAFPLGKGLASVVIRSRQPLMLVENTAERALALGAIMVGDKAAKSWLGVPMIVAGDVVGMVAIQDIEQEHRFDERDLHLLAALAAQVAPTVRNARLLAEAQAAAERDHRLFEITDRIRQATNFEAILEITTREISNMLNLRKAKIEIRVEPPSKSEGNPK